MHTMKDSRILHKKNIAHLKINLKKKEIMVTETVHQFFKSILSEFWFEQILFHICT